MVPTNTTCTRSSTRSTPNAGLHGVTPRAPLALPPGGAHWYRLGGIPTPEPESFWPSFTALAELLDGLPQPIVLGGFSQGTAMSWALGLGRGPAKRPLTIIALSGFIPDVEGLEIDVWDLDGYPVAIAHGTLDPVIPVDWGRAARDLLVAAGAEVAFHESLVPHTIDPEVIPVLRGFLAASSTPGNSLLLGEPARMTRSQSRATRSVGSARTTSRPEPHAIVSRARSRARIVSLPAPPNRRSAPIPPTSVSGPLKP